MADKNEISRKLNELLKKSEQFQQDIKDLNDIILYSGILDEKTVVLAPPVEESIPVTQVILRDDLRKENIPDPEIVPQTPIAPIAEKTNPGFNYIAEKKQAEEEKPNPIKPATKKEKPARKSSDIEKFIGERLITFIGIAVLFTGIAFFVKYAIDKNWINETGRSFIGILSGGILITIAHRLRNKFRTFSSTLIGGGIAVEYFTITYAYHVYHLFPGQLSALLILVAITLFTVALSVLYDRQELAIIAITGGFLTPLMIADGNGKIAPLGAYVLIFNTGMLILAYYKRWNMLNFIAYAFTVVLFGGALIKEFTDKKQPAYVAALIYATALYIVFFMMNVINNLRTKAKFKAGDILVLLSNTLLYYVAGYYILDHTGERPYHGLFTIGVALFNFSFASILYRRKHFDSNLVYLLIGIVVTFISLAGPVQLNGNNITLFWSAEAVLLLWLFQKSNIQLLGYASVLVNALMLGSLVLANWANSHLDTVDFYSTQLLHPGQRFFLNRYFVTSIFALCSLIATHFLLVKRQKEEMVPGIKLFGYKQFIGTMILVISYFSFFIEFYNQMDIRGFESAEKILCLATWSALFVALFLLVVRYRNFEHLKATSVIMGIAVMFLYMMYFNFSIIDIRDISLIKTNETGPIFLLHYMLTALTITIGVLIYHEAKATKKYEVLFDLYLWLICLTGVYIVSAETDHLIISSGYTAGNIEHLRSLSGNIAYPVIWGICSFIMMLIGMRKQIRQLRIISLCLLAFTIIKLIWLGINGDSEAGKIIAFVISGIVLIVVAFMYQKLKRLVTEENKTLQNESHE